MFIFDNLDVDWELPKDDKNNLVLQQEALITTYDTKDPDAGDVACLSSYQRRLQRVRHRKDNGLHAPADLTFQAEPIIKTKNARSILLLKTNRNWL